MKRDLILLLTVLSIATSLASAQSNGRGQPQINPRVTPLGSQRPKEDPGKSNKKEAPLNQESPAETVERAVNAHGGRQTLQSVRDSVAEGKLTFFSGKGSKNTIDITVFRKGNTRVQRILKQANGEMRQGSDGTSTWESANGMTVLAPRGLAGNFIESQTVRAVETLFDAPSKGSSVRDAGRESNTRVLEVEIGDAGKPARKTRFFVDETTSQVTRVEWATRDAKDLFGEAAVSTESYVYSDFRPVQGVPTPFRVERFVDGLKIEETQFTSVRYNTALKDDVFKP